MNTRIREAQVTHEQVAAAVRRLVPADVIANLDRLGDVERSERSASTSREDQSVEELRQDLRSRVRPR